MYTVYYYVTSPDIGEINAFKGVDICKISSNLLVLDNPLLEKWFCSQLDSFKKSSFPTKIWDFL